MPKKNWDQLLQSAPTVAFHAKLERQVVFLSFDKTRTYLFTSGNRNRCNPAGVECIYMSENRETAQAEFDKYYTDQGDLQPSVRYTGSLDAEAIIDLADPATRKHFKLMDRDFFTSFRTNKKATPLEQLGAAISRQQRIVAIRFPSDAMHQSGKTGYNLAVFREALQEPDSLKIIGPGNTVLEDWPEVLP